MRYSKRLLIVLASFAFSTLHAAAESSASPDSCSKLLRDHLAQIRKQISEIIITKKAEDCLKKTDHLLDAIGTYPADCAQLSFEPAAAAVTDTISFANLEDAWTATKPVRFATLHQLVHNRATALAYSKCSVLRRKK